KEDLHWLRDDLLAALRLSGEPRLIEQVEDSELERLHQGLLHILLLTLGVWGVPPVDAVLNDDLVSDRIDAVLAQALGVPLQEWDRTWRQIFSPEERQRLLRERTLAWREAAEIPVVALLTVPGDLPHRLRAARELYRDEVMSSTHRSFLASDHEWEEARQLGEDYAFLVVLRRGRRSAYHHHKGRIVADAPGSPGDSGSGSRR
ncbi:MAG: hypothetical protein MUF54_22585, partial [Polyangiaceae bacterium]|nr:hypothetical protein [Polyangiaceae bacterium]